MTKTIATHKRKHLTDFLTVSEVEFTFIIVGSMTARKQTWCWRSFTSKSTGRERGEGEGKGGRERERDWTREREKHWARFGFLKPQSSVPMTHFL